MGKLKSGLIKTCQACKNEFYVPKYRSESAKFCSLYCQNHLQHDKYFYKCDFCGKNCTASPSRRRYKKFCSVECREARADTEKQRRKKRKSLSVIRRGSVSQNRSLRPHIFRIVEPKCLICGYFEFECCLDLHHIDEDPRNNSIENIAILCCMCHRKLHKKLIILETKCHFIKEKVKK